MLGVGTSIWNRALAGKGAGNGGNPPSGSFLWTESFEDAENDTGFSNTRATPQYVETDTGALYPVPVGAIPIQKARPARNLAASSDTPSTQNITVVVGHVYAVRIGDESASGATAVCSGAFTGTLTGDAADPYAINGVATTTTLTVTITGSIRKLQVQDITHRAAESTAPDEYVSTGVGTGEEEVSNGTFDSGIDGWTEAADGSATVSAGVVTLACDAGTNGKLYQDVSLIHGKRYELSIDIISEPSGFYALVFSSTSFTGGITLMSSLTTLGVGTCKVAFTFDSSKPRLYMQVNGVGEAVSFDNISVKLCDPGLTGLDGFRYFTTALANTVDGSGVVTEGTGAALTGIALANVPGATNLADGTHDFSGGADTITLSATGYYTLWLMGTAQVTIAAGTATITGAGSATDGNPVTINCAATGTVTLTLDSGTLDEVNGSQVIMLEPGTVPTAFIPTDGSTASTDAAVLDFSGVDGFVTPNETRIVATGLGPNLIGDGTLDDATGWTLKSNSEISGGQLTIDTTGDSSWYENAKYSYTSVAGKTYLAIISASECTDQLWFRVGSGLNTDEAIIFTAAGVYASIITVATGRQITIEDRHSISGSYVVDSVYLFEIDPTDTTERIIDIDNWDGLDVSDILPHANIISVTQYAPGERP